MQAYTLQHEYMCMLLMCHLRSAAPVSCYSRSPVSLAYEWDRSLIAWLNRPVDKFPASACTYIKTQRKVIYVKYAESIKQMYKLVNTVQAIIDM